LVKPGLFPVELGRSFNKAEDLRLMADYKGDPISAEDALWVVLQAQAFVQQIDQRFMAGLN
jgi:uncharacterized protein (UPF0332 family)